MRLPVLSNADVLAARVDPRFRPRPPLNPPNGPGELDRIVMKAMRSEGIAFRYEPTFFPMHWENDVSLGCTPDFEVSDFPGLYLEVTGKSKVLRRLRKIDLVQRIHGIRIVLLSSPVVKLIEQDYGVVTQLLSPDTRKLVLARALGAA